jgi:HNH endonuclease
LTQRKTGRYIDANGYFRVWYWEADQRVEIFEHRLVMQEHIGRVLSDHETVHHKDGDRKNNRISNLELKMGAHGRGQNIFDLLGDVLVHGTPLVPDGRQIGWKAVAYWGDKMTLEQAMAYCIGRPNLIKDERGFLWALRRISWHDERWFVIGRPPVNLPGDLAMC